MRIWFAAALIAVLGWILWLQLREPAPIEVTVVTVVRGVVEDTVANTRAGSIKACRRSGLSMPQGGRVEALHVTEGDHVVAGQLLLELWNKDSIARTEQARATLDATSHRREQRCVEAKNLSREALRMESLFEQGLASLEIRESVRTRASSAEFSCEASHNDEEVARAVLELNKAQLAETQLRAPFAGVVAEITGEVGEFVTPSPPGIPTPPAIDLIDYSCLYVTAPIDEIDAGKLREGQHARVSLDAFRGEYFAATLERIAPYVQEYEKQARTVEVDVALDQGDVAVRLLVGYSADVDIILEARENVLRLPADALLEGDRVWRIDSDNRLEQQFITVGLRNWNYVEVVEGLDDGDRVVTSLDSMGLSDGVLVTIRDDKS
ncbi:efflux RND transporter periplasmic adaptor subunit [Luminiphilus sp.]|nr:efflux RND transporter periplasmic adaptor subunit [Luminiphilus sp.]